MCKANGPSECVWYMARTKSSSRYINVLDIGLEVPTTYLGCMYAMQRNVIVVLSLSLFPSLSLSLYLSHTRIRILDHMVFYSIR
jgi:hypothetical protein